MGPLKSYSKSVRNVKRGDVLPLVFKLHRCCNHQNSTTLKEDAATGLSPLLVGFGKSLVGAMGVDACQAYSPIGNLTLANNSILLTEKVTLIAESSFKSDTFVTQY